jgi:hypothetical protein
MSCRRASRLRLSAGLALAAAALLAAGLLAVAIPPGTTPASGAEKSARLGIYYFGGWSGTLSNSLFSGLLRGPYTGREPLYGWLDNTTQTMRTQLYWASRMGADFFNFLWYYRPEQAELPLLNKALGNYLAVKNHHGVGFAITYTNEPSFVIPRDQWRRVAEEWVTRYFSHPNYVRIAGRPALFVLEGNSFFEQHGGDPFGGAARGDANVNLALDELRQVARAHGLPGVFIVAGRYTPHNFDWQYFPEPFRGQSWDAVSQYGYPALAGEAPGERPFGALATAARAMWDRMAGRSDRPYIPVVTVGWDPRPWQARSDTPLYRFWYRRSPEEVAQLVRDAVAWAGRNPPMRVDSGPPLVLLPSWNELGEGSFLVPTKQDGYAYAQAIAAAVGLRWDPQRRALSVAVRGSGSVRVNGSRCRRSCSRRFDEGLVLSLRAQPAGGYRFGGWSGACSGREPTCTVLMDRARSAVARFVR